jgi:[ribosomal protein S5]-alanine N-acetyltransferase
MKTALVSAATLRRWRASDIDALVRYANNRNIWLNLRDRFPHPYQRSDAEAWIALCDKEKEPILQFAIDLNGEAIGGIGFERMADVHRMTAEVGYWIAERFWGRGIAASALEQATAYAFASLGLERLQAIVFEGNAASMRVLEKNGFAFEGRLQRHIFKDGRFLDGIMYARLR